MYINIPDLATSESSRFCQFGFFIYIYIYIYLSALNLMWGLGGELRGYGLPPYRIRSPSSTPGGVHGRERSTSTGERARGEEREGEYTGNKDGEGERAT
jgi:hypothetical protein